MKFWEIFLLTIVAVLVVFNQQSNCLQASICLGPNTGNILGNGCQNDKNPIGNTNNSPSGSNASESDPKLILEKGYIDFNNTVAAAENLAIRGFQRANKLAINQPTSAIQELQDAIDDCLDTFYDSGIFVLFALGKASALTNDTVRPTLVEACQKLQFVALELINKLRTATTLATQGLLGKEDARKQALLASYQIIEAGFAAMFYVIPISLQQATKAVADAQRVAMERHNQNQNADVVGKNGNATAAILDIDKAAKDSINRGASASNVNRLKELVKNAVRKIAEIASQVRDDLADSQKLAPTDPSPANNKYLKNFKDVSERIQKLIANLSMDFVPGVKSNSSSMKELQKAFVEVEHGNDEFTLGNRIAKRLIILALEAQGNIQSLLFNAAAESFLYGEIALYRRIVEGFEIVCEIL